MSEDLDEIKSKTIKGFFWRFAERISAQLVTFCVSVVLARILMPSDYGVIAIVNIFILIADTLVTSGLGTSLIQKKEADQLDFSTIFYAGLFLSIIFYCVLYFTAPFIAKLYDMDSLIIVLRIMGIRLPISAINSVQQAYVSRKMIYKKFFFATIIGTVVSAVVGIVMALKGYGIWALVFQSLINPFIDTVILFITVKWFPTLEFSIERLKQLFSFGCKIMISNLIGTIFNKLRSFIIGTNYCAEDLAFYNRGESLPQLITQNISSTLDSVLFPAMSKVQDDMDLVKQTARKALRLQAYVIIPLMLGMAVTADKLVKILLTDKWLMSVPFIQIVCVQEIIDILGASSLQSIKAIGRSDKILILEFIKKPVYVVIIFVVASIDVYWRSEERRGWLCLEYCVPS